MAVENIKSTHITNVEATPAVNDFGAAPYGVNAKVFADDIVVAAASSVGSTYRAIRLPSNARLAKLVILGDGTLNLTDFDAGVISVADETVLDDDSIIVAASTGGASSVEVNLLEGTFDFSKQLWEYTNATADFGGEVDIMISLDAIATAGGSAQVVAHAIVG